MKKLFFLLPFLCLGFVQKSHNPSPLPGFNLIGTLVVSNNDFSSTTGAQMKFVLDSTSPNIFTKLKADGSDLRILDSDNHTQLNYWLVTTNFARQFGEGYVNVTTPANGVKTLYLYGSNVSATAVSSLANTMQKISTSVSGLQGLLHYDEGTGTPVDALGLNTVTPVGTPGWGSTDGGQLGFYTNQFPSGHYRTFNGTSQLDKFNVLNGTAPNDCSISFWLRVATQGNTSGSSTVISWASAGAMVNGFDLILDFSGTTNSLNYDLYHNGSTFTIQDANSGSIYYLYDTNWHHIVLQWSTTSGMALWLDTIRIAANPSFTTVPAAVAQPLVIGGINDGSGNRNFSACAVDELAVFNRIISRDEIVSEFERRVYSPANYVYDKFTGRQVVLSASLSGEDTAVQEPTVFTNGAGVYEMVYTGGYFTASPSLFLAHSSDGISWTKDGRIIGQGTSFPSAAMHSSVQAYGGTYYAYFADSVSNTGWGMQSANLTSWSGATKLVTGSGVSGTWPFIAGNHWSLLDGGTYYHFYEATTGPIDFQMNTFTSTTPLGAWTQTTTDFMPHLLIYTNGEAGGPNVIKLANYYYMLMHFAPSALSQYPSYLAMCRSSDLKTWTKMGGYVLADFYPGQDVPAQQQLAHASIFDFGTSVGVYCSMLDDTVTHVEKIGLLTAPVSLQSFVRESPSTTVVDYP